MPLRGSSLVKEIPDYVRKTLADLGVSLLDSTFHVSIDDREEIITWAIEGGKSSFALWHIADWDSEQLSVKCAKIDKIISLAEEASSDLTLWHEISSRAKSEKIDNFFFRAAAENPALIKEAEEAGFRTIGIHLDFLYKGHEADIFNQLHERIRAAEDKDVKDIVSMAELIRDDRFHRDGVFPGERISRLWRTSVYNAVTQWADKVYVYEQSGKVAGFIIVTEDSSIPLSSAGAGKRIFLIAVLPELRRQGVGKALVRAAVHYSGENASPYLLVGTQGSNSAAISLYQSCGFKLNSVSQELSWWFNENK